MGLSSRGKGKYGHGAQGQGEERFSQLEGRMEIFRKIEFKWAMTEMQAKTKEVKMQLNSTARIIRPEMGLKKVVPIRQIQM
ncbi:hypothetical protein VNO78_23203 [Psophocarpus tetragonolobus]|uniref:Uncharacterized protein n=1 Tax=Psophocarpus tetragonolobus TaxID=3891 RepID=A0AAN9S3P6_PSOTE